MAGRSARSTEPDTETMETARFVLTNATQTRHDNANAHAKPRRASATRVGNDSSSGHEFTSRQARYGSVYFPVTHRRGFARPVRIGSVASEDQSSRACRFPYTIACVA